jgi:hypothetical protein
MRWILTALMTVIAPLAWGSPFLVCDPYPAGLDASTKPVSFVVTGLSGTPLSVPATINADSTIQLHYDLSTLAHGSYTVTASAVNVFGGVSGASDPFSFTSGVPATPTNIRIVP